MPQDYLISEIFLHGQLGKSLLYSTVYFSQICVVYKNGKTNFSRANKYVTVTMLKYL